MKIAVIFNHNKLLGKLTKFFTGCYAYHVGFVDIEHMKLYDMSLLRRRRDWPGKYKEDEVILFDSPCEIPIAYLETALERDDHYGWMDFVLFLLRPLFHVFGKSTRNAGGIICSEQLNNDIWANGFQTPFDPKDEPPSPCHIFKWLSERR